MNEIYSYTSSVRILLLINYKLFGVTMYLTTELFLELLNKDNNFSFLKEICTGLNCSTEIFPDTNKSTAV